MFKPTGVSTVARFIISLVTLNKLFFVGFYLQTEMMCDHSLWSSSPADLTCRGNASAREFQVTASALAQYTLIEKCKSSKSPNTVIYKEIGFGGYKFDLLKPERGTQNTTRSFLQKKC
jgi:hypothetical protein